MKTTELNDDRKRQRYILVKIFIIKGATSLNQRTVSTAVDSAATIDSSSSFKIGTVYVHVCSKVLFKDF